MSRAANRAAAGQSKILKPPGVATGIDNAPVCKDLPPLALGNSNLRPDKENSKLQLKNSNTVNNNSPCRKRNNAKSGNARAESKSPSKANSKSRVVNKNIRGNSPAAGSDSSSDKRSPRNIEKKNSNGIGKSPLRSAVKSDSKSASVRSTDNSPRDSSTSSGLGGNNINKRQQQQQASTTGSPRVAAACGGGAAGTTVTNCVNANSTNNVSVGGGVATAKNTTRNKSSASDTDTTDTSNSGELEVRAVLEGGEGDCAWQHAQLFRIADNDSLAVPFLIDLQFQ